LRKAERASGVELMEVSEEPLRGARRGDLLQLFEVGFELLIEVLVIELVGLHHMPVRIDDLDSVEHGAIAPNSAIPIYPSPGS
jgi:hypothetical protein